MKGGEKTNGIAITAPDAAEIGSGIAEDGLISSMPGDASTADADCPKAAEAPERSRPTLTELPEGGEYASALRERIDSEAAIRIDEARELAIRRRDGETCIRAREHMERLFAQSEEFAGHCADFDLMRELSNPVFVRLTAPGVGLSVEDAYFAANRERLDQLRQQELKAAAAAAIRSGSMRPVENRGAASPNPVRASERSRAQREELKQRIYAAAALGQKIYR